jgi:hypothetical protein
MIVAPSIPCLLLFHVSVQRGVGRKVVPCLAKSSSKTFTPQSKRLCRDVHRVFVSYSGVQSTRRSRYFAVRLPCSPSIDASASLSSIAAGQPR